ncbi:hypothetical protein [Oenococcus kitaharae]|uniref:Uncharacterized protein n=1 Tax=Oenococcus kitaharae DSM 17330 TaxID=1045004 RepID=G9WHE1_9LACO|nr:hypothetical protein [Oenococcus kitaharae]EHN59933.1 hypothetical protein OKIT_1863 [Oenococcus kitaharae DSM 17330]OEY82118.1 hypothetical protein NT95_07275 [Oenococcus kitaharae]OEY82427.1 hypothetical protein NT96_06505 [Oenococcus kitaharae]OEY83831.1 hypothetical protein NV75_05375 [Oenococcus kitaharae]
MAERKDKSSSPLRQEISHELEEMRYDRQESPRKHNGYSFTQKLISWLVVLVVVAGIVYSLIVALTSR